MTRMEALKVLVQRLMIDQANVTGTDVADIAAISVKSQISKPARGDYRVSFTIKCKVKRDSKTGEALLPLLKEAEGLTYQ